MRLSPFWLKEKVFGFHLFVLFLVQWFEIIGEDPSPHSRVKKITIQLLGSVSLGGFKNIYFFYYVLRRNDRKMKG